MIIWAPGSASGSTATPPTARTGDAAADRLPMGRNGGGWAHYVGAGEVRPVTGWATMAMATDWSRPPRQMPGTSFWYVHTDQWRYDGYRADALASPTARAGSSVSTRWTYSPRRPPWVGCRSIPVRPLQPGCRRRARRGPRHTGIPSASNWPPEAELAVTDPDHPANWPRVLDVWRPTCWARRARATSTSCATCSARRRTCRPNRLRSRCGRGCHLDRRIPDGKLDLLMSIDFRMTSTTLLSTMSCFRRRPGTRRRT